MRGWKGRGRTRQRTRRAGGSVRAANYNHSCGWRDEETPGVWGVHDDGPGGTKDDGDDERPLPGGWKRVYLLTVVHTGAGTENGPRWKSAAFGGTGQENWLTTFRTGSELPNRSPIPRPLPFWTATTYDQNLRSGLMHLHGWCLVASFSSLNKSGKYIVQNGSMYIISKIFLYEKLLKIWKFLRIICKNNKNLKKKKERESFVV